MINDLHQHAEDKLDDHAHHNARIMEHEAAATEAYAEHEKAKLAAANISGLIGLAANV